MTTTATPTPEASMQTLERSHVPEYPTRRDEAWRYAPHQVLGRLSFGPAGALTKDVPSGIDQQIPALDGPRIVVVNGAVDLGRSNLANLPDGLRLVPLADVSTEQIEIVETHFTPDVEIVDDAFVSLNKMYGRDGALVEVGDGRQVDAPIHIVNIAVANETGDGCCTGVVVRIGSGSSATIVESRIGAGAALGGSNTRTTVLLDDGATLDHLVLQDVPSTDVHLSTVEVTQRAGSTLRARSFNLGAVYGRLVYRVNLAGEGAHVELGGLYYGAGEQTLDQQVTVVHSAKNCTSRQSYRGVLDEASTGVFNGAIDVRPGADGTDAEQSNDNLLLSHRAEANTQPRLEILADDVVCKHGATVGQLDEAAMYYLRTRGIPAADARRLLIAAFAEQAVDGIGIDAVSTWIRSRLGVSDA